MAFPLPDKPSIAVLPFVNMSKDPEQEYIADGISENLITALSNIPEFFVIARNSTFSYKGKSVKIKQVSEDLGVRYVVEGSIQKEGDQLRIIAQLIDALKGHHLWSEKYDRQMEGLFDLLDDIVKNIASALHVELVSGIPDYGCTESLEAWKYLIQGEALFYHMTKEHMIKARELFEKALESDPNCVCCLGYLSASHLVDFRRGFSESPADSYKLGVEIANKALGLSEESAGVQRLIAFVYFLQRQHDKAIISAKKAISIEPNYADAYNNLGRYLHYSGKPEEGIGMVKKAMRLHPYYRPIYLLELVNCYRMAGKYEEAIDANKILLERAQKGEFNLFFPHLLFAEIYMEIGQKDKARSHAAKVLKANPKFSLNSWRKTQFYKDPADTERRLKALRKVGLPENPPLPLPDKPSIAVLPFVNMSGDPEQEYISDGISEEIITALSKTPKMFVIARTSSFRYKGKEVDVRTVGRELGVRYVLEGSVRKSRDQLRITALLVDAKTGNHLWAERYDRELKDVFDVQDEITMKIMTALQVKLASGEQARLIAKGTNNLEAYMKFLLGNNHFERGNKEDNFLAQQIAKETIALDSEYPAAYWLLGWTHLLDVYFRPTKSPKESLMQAFKMAQKTIALDESYAPAYSLLGYLLLMKREHDKAIAQGERALALNPNSADAHAFLARSLNFADRCEESVAMYKKALRLNPFPPGWYFYQLCGAYNCRGMYKDAIEAGKKAVHLEPNNLWAHLILINPYFNSGREQEARAKPLKYSK
jgi:TolB-like protein/Tfp pilus assembly protein PilF